MLVQLLTFGVDQNLPSPCVPKSLSYAKQNARSGTDGLTSMFATEFITRLGIQSRFFLDRVRVRDPCEERAIKSHCRHPGNP